MKSQQETRAALFTGTLVLVVTLAGLALMRNLGGTAGFFAFSTFALLWLLFGLVLAWDSFSVFLRRRS